MCQRIWLSGHHVKKWMFYLSTYKDMGTPGKLQEKMMTAFPTFYFASKIIFGISDDLRIGKQRMKQVNCELYLVCNT